MFPTGSSVYYKRDDGRTGLATVLSYEQATGEFRLQTKNSGIVIRYWAGVKKA